MEAEAKVKRKVNPKEKASLLSQLFFLYQIPIFLENYKKKLTEYDLYEPLDEHRSKKLGDRLEDVWQQQNKKQKKMALHIALLKIVGFELALIGILKLINQMVLIVVLPLSVRGLVSYFDTAPDITKSYAYMYAGLIILSLLSDLFISCHTGLAINYMSMKTRVACSSLIYRKSLRLSRTAFAETTIGHIINLLSNDVRTFDHAFLLWHYAWLAPVQTVVGTYLLYRMIGLTAFSGVGFLLLFLPLQTYFGKKASELRLETAVRTDERVRLMNEILNGIQVIKMYTWEKPFAKLISFARRYEIKPIQANFLLDAISFCLEMIMTRIAVFITIIIFIYLGNDVSADAIYPVVAIYSVLRPSISFFTSGISSISQTYVTISRIQAFLSLDEQTSLVLHNTDFEATEHIILHRTPKVSLKNVSAQWAPKSSDQTLTNINLDIAGRQLVAVVGQVGSGKSSLFNVILKELPIYKGSIVVDGKISYASQEAWLFSASIRQNILFGEPYVEDRYKIILKICALEPDLTRLPHGDKTIVGEKGKALSGGQKARISLARCVYKQADIYLLDDPLSAVDSKVAKHIFEECIAKFLSDKICILITHQLQYLKSADRIMIVNDGQIATEGTYKQLKTSGLDFAALLCEFNSEEKQEDVQYRTIVKQKSESSSNQDEDNSNVVKNEEAVQSGGISFGLYAAYFRYGGNYITIVLLFVTIIAAQGTGKVGDYYISEWVNVEQRIAENKESGTFSRKRIIYECLAIIILTVVLSVGQLAFVFMFFIRASVNMHNAVFEVISHATMQFFNANPTGRILNRFSNDMGTIDECLPSCLYEVLEILLSFFGVIAVTSIVNPWFILPAFGILTTFWLLRNIYLETSRNVKRIEGITRSPILTHITTSMHGLSTIRAFSAQDTLVREFDDHLDLHSSACYLHSTSNKAFDFSLTLICSAVVATVTATLVFLDKDYYGSEAGLILTQYLSIVRILQWTMRGWSNLENNMISVERVLEYTKIETEPVRKFIALPKYWPEFGKIVFQNVSMRYNRKQESVLKTLNFTIFPQEKVGIVGRTGAGKSSIVSALFQLYDIEGSILIDDIDTTKLPLNELRSKISIIPQDPVLFSGTLRKNLDPFDKYDNETLWNALENVKLADVVSENVEGLSSNVTEGGTNYSVGQRQLICLARAIIQNNRILVMDEATANVDPYTDGIIQETIRKKFTDCTIITIAHRLHTIMDSDRVLVIAAGKVVEFDRPYTLLQDSNSKFYAMVETTGKAMTRNLHNIAEKSFKSKYSK